MSEKNSFLVIDGQPVSAEEALLILRRHMVVHNNSQWLAPIVNDVWIRKTASQEGIPEVSNEELQKGVDAFRAQRGLHSVATTQNWLKEHYLSHKDLEESIESQLLYDKWGEKAVGKQIPKYFEEHQADFDVASLSQIVVADEGVAKELKDQLTKGDADFATLARAYSLDSSAQRGGYVGEVTRSSLSPEAQTAIFGAKEGQPIGPLRTDQGYHIILVQEFLPASLTAEVKNHVRDRLLKPIIEARRSKSKIQVSA